MAIREVGRVRSERLAEEKLQLSAKLAVAEEKLRKSEEARVACQAECGYTKSDVEELRKEASRNRATIEELTRVLAETRAQNFAL